MAKGLIGTIQKEAQRQNSINPKLSLEEGKASASSTTTSPASAPTTDATAPAEQPKKKKWLMPVLIGGGVLIVGILAYVLLKRKK
jgi:hypothetical protein